MINRTEIVEALREAYPRADLSEVMQGTVLAGGFVRDTVGRYSRLGDIDFFVNADNITTLPKIHRVTWATDQRNKSCYVSRVPGLPTLHLVTVGRDPIAFIKDRFDFVACCGAVELGNDARVWQHDAFERDVKERNLTLNTTLNLTTRSLRRAFKFVGRGWTLGPKVLAQLVTATALSTPLLRDALIDERQLQEQILLAIEPVQRTERVEEPVRVEPTHVLIDVQPAREYTEPTRVTAERIREQIRAGERIRWDDVTTRPLDEILRTAQRTI